MQFWQLGESHYWGHNAIIRVEPFMRALRPGAAARARGGLAGGIMSHDFVEAALMRRAGYHVWLVSDLVGSYEQQPPDLLSELQRDRRWCQGNLQNARLMAEPGLHRVHRAMFAIGAMSYLSAPLWLAFLVLGRRAVARPARRCWRRLATPRRRELIGLWLWTLVHAVPAARAGPGRRGDARRAGRVRRRRRACWRARRSKPAWPCCRRRCACWRTRCSCWSR